MWLFAVHKIVSDAVGSAYEEFRGMSRLFWPPLVWIVLFLPFMFWFCIPFKAPLAPVGGWGWRIAKILEGATQGKGRYGIEGERGRGMAKWGTSARTFTKEALL